MIDLVELGKRISTLRKKFKLSQQELSEILFVTRQAISKWENGKSMPLLECLCDMSILFNVSVDYLIGNLEIPQNDYVKLFERIPRQGVILRFLDDLNIHNAQKILPLLTSDEKSYIYTYLNNTDQYKYLDDILGLFASD